MKPSGQPPFYQRLPHRGLFWEKRGEHDKAMADFNHALAINANDAAARYNRGKVWYNKREYDKALSDSTNSYSSIPNMPPTIPSLGFTRRAPTRSTAMENKPSRTPTRLTNWTVESIRIVLTLSLRPMPRAATSRRPLSGRQGPSKGQPDESATDKKAEARSRLELYRQGKPYREVLKKK